MQASSALCDDQYWTLPIPPQGSPPANLVWPATSPDYSECALCHPQQAEQWKLSLHAKAISPGLLGQLEAFDDETQTMCLNCHAPRREQQAVIKETGTANTEKLGGIDCSSCHRRAHQTFGPRDVPSTPHGAVFAKSLFWTSEFCSSCHQFEEGDASAGGKLLENTLTEWEASPYRRQEVMCQDCHMPDGAHNFPGIHDPDMLRRGLGIKVERKPKGITATVTNHGAGHALPTYITPRIRVIVQEQKGPSRKELVIQRAMDWEENGGWRELENGGWRELFDNRLMPGESREVSLDLPPRARGRAEVIVEPDADYHDRVYPFLIRELQQEISQKSMEQLMAAHSVSASSAYTAYKIECGSALKKAYQCPE